MKFEPAFLEEIRNRLPVSHVCGARVQLKKAGKEWRGLSPFTAEKSPSFYVNDGKRAWFDFSSQRQGDVFDFVMQTEGVSFVQAVERCAAEAGLSMPANHRGSDAPLSESELRRRAEAQHELERRQEKRRQDQETDESKVRDIARRIWTEGRSIAGTLADDYLKARGIDFGAQFPALRFHEKLEYRDEETGHRSYWPAMIAAVQHPASDRFLAVWRIYLDGFGGKAPFPNPKMGLGAYAQYGGCVRLGRPSAVANPCEGIETGLGIYGLLGQRQGVQATLGTSGLINFIPPTGCISSLIWPDGDADKSRPDRQTGQPVRSPSPGLEAAKKLHALNVERGHKSSIQPIAKRGIDWLDVWNAAKDKMNDG